MPTLSALVRDAASVRESSSAEGLAPISSSRAEEFEIVSYGEHAVLARRKAQVFAVDASLGVVGPLALPPDAVWVGLADGDRVFAADHGGRLFAAPSIERARDRFDAINVVSTAVGREAEDGTAPEARGWDSAGPFIAAVLDATVFVSRDGGVTFDAFVPDPGLRLHRVVVRFDGAIVVTGETTAQRRTVVDYQRALAAHVRKGQRAALAVDLPPELGQLTSLVSTSGGRHFVKPRFQPRSIDRSGAWITGESAGASPRVLGRDGTWLELEGRAMPARASARDWLRWTMSLAAAPQAPFVTAADPPPPSPKPGGVDGDGPRGGVITLTEEGEADRDPTCAPAACVRGVPSEIPPPRRWEFGLLSDAARTRAPSVGIRDRARDTISLTKVPDGCVPQQLASAGDVAVLLCKDASAVPRTHVHLGGPDGLWREAGTLGVDATTLAKIGVASDGGVLLQERCASGRDCAAWMWPPATADAEGAGWRKIVVPEAAVYRAAPRGVVLAIVPTSHGDRFDLVADVPGARAPRVVVRSAPLPGRLRQATVASSSFVVRLQVSDRADAVYLVDDVGGLTLAPFGASNL